jgi:hypothetical protein
MERLAAKTCESATPDQAGRDKLLGDGDGLFLRIRPHRVRRRGTKTWMIEYEFEGHRRKFTIGVYDAPGSPGESIAEWLEYGRLSLAHADACPPSVGAGHSCRIGDLWPAYFLASRRYLA